MSRPESDAAPRVGPYVLLTRLGEGGMGIVHLAQGPGPDRRRVALKVLRPQVVGDQEARGRLAREVASLQRVRSPWIAEMVDADPWAEVPYVVTRYVPGLSLHEHVVEEGPVAGGDLLWLAGCLAEGLAAVHAAGVLHRDVKPGNVLMEGRTPILIDFGLARVAEDVRLTQTGWLLGTPGYLAPEILYGDDATPAADVHAWAATVAYAAMGRAPYGRGPAMAVMDRTRRGQHDLAGIEAPLRDVLAAALSPDPLDRPLLREILAWLRPLTTRPEDPPAPPPGVLFADDDFTLPLALAGQAQQAQQVPPPEAPPAPVTPLLPEAPITATLPITAAPAPIARQAPPPPPERPGPPVVDAVTRLEQEWDDEHGLGPEADTPASAPRPPLAERLRQLGVVVLLALGVGTASAAAPWVTLAAVSLTVWVVRAGSLASTAVAERRSVRGARWHDRPRWLVTTPWHLVRAITGAAVLLAWSAGLAAAAGLVCYAVALDLPAGLIATGASFAVALWTGPGSTRLREPGLRVISPLCRTALPFLLTCAVLLAVTVGLGLLSVDDGVSWAPWTGPPFGG